MASENQVKLTTELPIAKGIPISPKRHSIDKVKPEQNFILQLEMTTPIVGRSILKKKTAEIVNEVKDDIDEGGGFRTTVDTLAYVDSETGTRASQSSVRRTPVRRMIDSGLLKREEFRVLTLENVERLDHARKKYKKELKELARYRLDEDPTLEMDNVLKESDFTDYPSELDLRKTFFLNGSYDDQLVAIFEDTSSTMSSSSEEEVPVTCSVSIKEEFLEDFDKLPEIKEIPPDAQSVIDDQHQEKKILDFFDPDLIGKFVNPLTGDSESNSFNEFQDPDDTDSNHIGPIYEEQELEKEMSSDLDWPDDDWDNIGKGEPEVNFVEVINVTQSISNKRASSIISTKFKDTESIDVVDCFIDDLIDKVVNAVEVVDAFTSKLDKTKLINELIEAVDTYNMEKSYNKQLNSKAADHYRRTNKQWATATLPLHVEMYESRRYQQALNLLDHLREKAMTTKKKAMHVLDSVLIELESAEMSCSMLIERFEQRVRKTIVDFDSEFLNKSVERNLRLMQDLRLEIGESRMELIAERDTLARLQEQMVDFEQITDDLTMTQYIKVHQDVLKMSKLLEGRTITFDQLHLRCAEYLNRVAYYREKTDITAALLQSEKNRLQQLETKWDELRARLRELNLERSRYQAQKQALDLKAGLLTKPALMFDFDKCTELVLEKREVVFELRRRMEKLMQRCSVISNTIQSVC